MRAAIIKIVDEYLNGRDHPIHECRPEEAFHFCQSRSFVIPTGGIANDVENFFQQLKTISNASLYFHFFEARLLLGRHSSAFSHWLTNRGRPNLATAIDSLNPYVRTPDELRQDIVRVSTNPGTVE